MGSQSVPTHPLCPWWLAYSFDNPLRRLFQDPVKVLGPYVLEGMTVLDIGCGMGYFSIGMARLVGATGVVMAVDIQQEMLDVMEKRAERAGIAGRIQSRLCISGDLGTGWNADFALTFWMVHEVPDREGLLRQIHKSLKPSGRYLLVEPKWHVSREHFEETVRDCERAGFKTSDYPKISLSRAVLFEKKLP